MIHRKFRFNPISIFDLQTSISNICFKQSRMSLSFLAIVETANISLVFIIVSHTEILGELHIISIQTFIQTLIYLEHFGLLLRFRIV